MIDFNIPVEEEILYLANAMTEEARKKMFLANAGFVSDAQRKAVMAKMGGGGGGGNRQQVYYRGSPNGGSGGNGGSSGGNTGGRTVQTTRNAGSGGGSHYTQAGDLTSSWVTSLSPQQMAEEYKNDPERLKKAIQEQINAGAYMGISINGHEPSVMDIINGGIAPNYTKPIEVKNLSERDFYAQKNDPMAGAEAVAIDPMTGKPMQEEQGSWEHLSPTQQVEQDITGGTTASGSGTVQPSTTPGGNYTVTPSTGGGTTTGAGDVGGAIETIDLSGNTGGPTAAEISAANLSAFQQALANAHF